MLNEKWDLYVPFMELGLKVLCNQGVFSMIVPYPLTNQKYAKKLRRVMSEEYCLLEIVDLNGTKIFENATISNCITFVRNCKSKGKLIISHISENKDIVETFRTSPQQMKQSDETYVWNLTNEERIANRYSHMHQLGDFCYISKGMVINADETQEKGAFRKDDLISNTYDKIHCRKYIEAKDIDKYQVKRVRYLEWDTERCPKRLSRPTFRELYDCPKLMINRLGELKVYLDTNIHFLHSDSMFSAVLWKDIQEVDNKSVTTSVKKFCKLSRNDMEKLSQEVNLYYLLGILNSSYAKCLLADQRGGDYHIYPEHIRHLPIPLVEKGEQNAIGSIAKEILERKVHDEDCSYLEKELDELVEKLYF